MKWSLDIETKQTTSVSKQEKVDMVRFSQKVSKIQDSYIMDRFTMYNSVVSARMAGRLCAFQFIQEFQHNDEIFVYYGPMFSKMSCFLDLFLTSLNDAVVRHQTKNIHLLAEIQNPEVLILFKALFEDYAYPAFKHVGIPDENKKKVAVFSQYLSHIQNINFKQFTSQSEETLYQSRQIHSSLESWLRLRNIDFTSGTNILLYAMVPHEDGGRMGLLNQLKVGREKMSNWKTTKHEILKRFEEGATNYV
ncbi:hypothetical protein [Fredinandcohnia sp. 179-A 10B2 NHS]|uniref:hypothetical protein n=1 Tax=Fredinandcohnia sp. 179-A 10B2 NHS TaxID=3235176 RepID=UPI00399F8727